MQYIFVFGSYSSYSHKKLPQTWQLKITEIYFGAILNTRGLKSKYFQYQFLLEAWERTHSIFSAILVFLGLYTNQFNHGLCPYVTFFYLSLSILSLIRTLIIGLKNHYWPCPRWLSWLEHHPVDQKVVGSITSQGTYLSCAFDAPGWGACGRQPINVSVTSMFLCLSLSSFLSKKQWKSVLGWG